MEVTLEGIVTEVKPEQPENAEVFIEVAPSGIITVLRLSFDIPLGNHAAVKVVGATPLNALLPMEVTLEGIVTEVNPLQPLNAESPIVVTLEGIITVVKPEQPENAESPIVVTLEGIVTEVKLEQLENAPPPISATPSGIVTEVKPVQPENAESLMVVTPSGISIVCNEAHPAKRFAAIILLSPVKVTRSNVAYALGKNVDNGVDVLQGIVTSLRLEHSTNAVSLSNATQPQLLLDDDQGSAE